MKKSLMYFFILLFISFIIPPPSLAIVGQLNYDMGTAPEQIDVSPYIEALNTCKKEAEKINLLNQQCEQEKSQLKEINTIGANTLESEKKKVLALEIALAISIIFSVGLIVFLGKKRFESSENGV